MAFLRKTRTKNTCGPNLRRIRSARGWSQNDLAMHCQLAGLDVSRVTIATIEANGRVVRDFELRILAGILGVSIDELVP